MLSLPRAQVQSLVRELKSCKPQHSKINKYINKYRGFGTWQTLVWVPVLPASGSETLVKSNEPLCISVSLSRKWGYVWKFYMRFARKHLVCDKALYRLTSIHKAGRWWQRQSSGRRKIWTCNSAWLHGPLYLSVSSGVLWHLTWWFNWRMNAFCWNSKFCWWLLNWFWRQNIYSGMK